MEAFGILGLTFGIVALVRVTALEKKIKKSGVLKEKTEIDDK